MIYYDYWKKYTTLLMLFTTTSESISIVQVFFRSILENWTLFGPISSDTGHLKSYKYSYITNIIDS